MLIGGVVLSRSADALAVQTGLWSGFTGLLLLSFATSLPEMCAVVFAVRLRRLELALGEVLGANIFNLGIFFLADIVYDGPLVLAEAGRFEIVPRCSACSLPASC